MRLGYPEIYNFSSFTRKKEILILDCPIQYRRKITLKHRAAGGFPQSCHSLGLSLKWKWILSVTLCAGRILGPFRANVRSCLCSFHVLIPVWQIGLCLHLHCSPFSRLCSCIMKSLFTLWNLKRYKQSRPRILSCYCFCQLKGKTKDGLPLFFSTILTVCSQLFYLILCLSFCFRKRFLSYTAPANAFFPVWKRGQGCYHLTECQKWLKS